MSAENNTIDDSTEIDRDDIEHAIPQIPLLGLNEYRIEMVHGEQNQHLGP